MKNRDSEDLERGRRKETNKKNCTLIRVEMEEILKKKHHEPTYTKTHNLTINYL